jgi:hypothetical protein
MEPIATPLHRQKARAHFEQQGLTFTASRSG